MGTERGQNEKRMDRIQQATHSVPLDTKDQMFKEKYISTR